MNRKSRKYWLFAILLAVVIWSCYPLSFNVQDGSSTPGTGVEPLSEAPLPEQAAEDKVVEDELDLYELPFEELLEIQVATENSLDLYSLPLEELLEIQVASVI